MAEVRHLYVAIAYIVTISFCYMQISNVLFQIHLNLFLMKF